MAADDAAHRPRLARPAVVDHLSRRCRARPRRRRDRRDPRRASGRPGRGPARRGAHGTAHGEPGSSTDSDVAATLYRVARETLANIAKHAQASTVDIDLAVDDGPTPQTVVLRVADDGIGIRADQLDKRAEGHLGLRLLIDRVADQGGRLTVAAR